jgi:hypothetical protein
VTITIPTGDLVGILGDVIPFASTDDEVDFLHAVRLEWDGEMLHALTTDRFRAAISSWHPDDIEPGEEIQDDLFTDWGSGDEPWKATLALPDAAQIAKVFKLPAKEMRVPLTVDYEADRRRLRIIRNKDTGHSAITIGADDLFVDTPDLRRLLATADKATGPRQINYSAKLLADFAKVRPRGPLNLRFTKGLTHVAIGDRFVGAIMPARTDDENFLRDGAGVVIAAVERDDED